MDAQKQKNVFEAGIKAIFGDALTDYLEYAQHGSVALVLMLPTGKWLDLPKQLDAMVKVLGRRGMTARFVGSNGWASQQSAGLRVDLSGTDPPGKVSMTRHFNVMTAIDLVEAMDEVVVVVGHRNLKSRFDASHGSHVYMMIHAECRD